MKKEKIDLRKELRSYKYEFDLLQKIPCSKSENKKYKELLENGQELPKGVFRYKYFDDSESNEFYTVYEPDLTEQEIVEYLTYKKLEILNTIKNCVVFFTVLTVISLIVYLLFFLKIFG